MLLNCTVLDATDLRGMHIKETRPDPTFVRSACAMVSAFMELRKSWQMCLDLEKTRSTEQLVAGIARKSRAILASVGNTPAFFCFPMSKRGREW